MPTEDRTTRRRREGGKEGRKEGRMDTSLSGATVFALFYKRRSF
jgi:hypothetical protein